MRQAVDQRFAGYADEDLGWKSVAVVGDNTFLPSVHNQCMTMLGNPGRKRVQHLAYR